MSPEQAQGEPLDPRSDIYAMGVILFELFTGVLPFDASNFAAIVYKKLHEPLELETGPATTLPDSLKPVIRKALAMAAADRYCVDTRARSRLARTRAHRRLSPNLRLGARLLQKFVRCETRPLTRGPPPFMMASLPALAANG